MNKEHNAIYDHSMRLVWPVKTLGRGNMCSNVINIKKLATQGSEGEHSRKTICTVQSGEGGPTGLVGPESEKRLGCCPRCGCFSRSIVSPAPLPVGILLASMEYFQMKFLLFT